MVEMGLVGIMALGLFIIIPLIKSILPRKHQAPQLANLAYAFAVALIGLGVHLFFIDLVYSTYVWLHIGLAMSAIQISQQELSEA
jgi:hypothetical protein